MLTIFKIHQILIVNQQVTKELLRAGIVGRRKDGKVEIRMSNSRRFLCEIHVTIDLAPELHASLAHQITNLSSTLYASKSPM